MTFSKPRNEQSDKTWQQTKSENTRASILEATLACFYELGYASTTTEKVAKKAGVSRGAMLHHFPSRSDLIGAAVDYINQKRLQMFEEQELQINEGATHSNIDEGIDAYWEQLQSPLFTVFHELKVVSRTDPELKALLEPAMREFDDSWSEVAQAVFPDLALSGKYQTATLLTLHLLEGMAIRDLSNARSPELMIPWLKDQLKQMFDDVKAVERSSSILRKPQ